MERRQLEFFVCGSLRNLVPDEHVLARVDQVLDLGWLREEVAELYARGVGRPGIDPEAALRLMNSQAIARSSLCFRRSQSGITLSRSLKNAGP
jgi:hypothetical protein